MHEDVDLKSYFHMKQSPTKYLIFGTNEMLLRNMFLYKVLLLFYICDVTTLNYICGVTTLNLKHLYIVCKFCFCRIFCWRPMPTKIVLLVLVYFFAWKIGIRLWKTGISCNSLINFFFALQDIEQGTSSIKVILLNRYTNVTVQIYSEIVSIIFCQKSDENLSVVVCSCWI